MYKLWLRLYIMHLTYIKNYLAWCKETQLVYITATDGRMKWRGHAFLEEREKALITSITKHTHTLLPSPPEV